jgi:hypothetical protein
MRAAVKTTDDFFAEMKRLGGIGRKCHPLRQCGKFGPSEPPLGVKLVGEADNAGLLLWRQTFDLFDDLCRGHAPKLP